MAVGPVKAEMALFGSQRFADMDADPKVGSLSVSTFHVKDTVAVSLLASVMVTMAVPEPLAVGVPDTLREEDMLTALGSPLML